MITIVLHALLCLLALPTLLGFARVVVLIGDCLRAHQFKRHTDKAISVVAEPESWPCEYRSRIERGMPANHPECITSLLPDEEEAWLAQLDAELFPEDAL